MSADDEVASLRTRIAALEAELAEARGSESFQRSLLEDVASLVMRVDSEIRLVEINRVVEGFTREQVLGTSFLGYVPPAHRGTVETTIRNVLATGSPGRYHIEGDGARGQRAYYDCYVVAMPDNGGPRCATVVAIDVTANHARERALDETRKTLELVRELTALGIWSWDMITGEVSWSEPMHRLTGLDEPLLIADYVDRLVHPDDRQHVRDGAERTTDEEAFQRPPHRIVRPDGEIRWVITSGRVVRDEDGKPLKMVGATLDVTDQRRTEEHLQRTQRLEAVGQLAAGVAHNFNNMLATILPVLDLVRGQVAGPYQSLVDDARHSGARAAELVRQLMTFAGRRESARRSNVRASEVVGRAVDLCRRVVGRGVELRFVDRSDDATLDCDAGAIEQAVVNIVLNARDAVVDGGRGRGLVEVEVDLVPDDAHSVRIRVRDDGSGMDEDTRRRIFEPFFTTKEIGRGTGLGLATAYATVKEHAGTIHCESALGRGTTFELVLPRSDATATAERPPSADARPHTVAKVMLVDDDSGVRNAITLLLEDFGHQVISAENGETGVELAREHPDVRLVLIDRSLPDGAGAPLVSRLRTALPAARLVYFTGDDVTDAEARLVDGVLGKPASLAEIEALLDDHVAG